MRLISLNEAVPQMRDAPHKIYMLEFDHSKGELLTFKLNQIGFLHQFEQFRDVDDKTTLNLIGVEGDKQGRDHDRIKNTHALVADLRPLGIYFLYWEKPEPPEGLREAFKSPLLARYAGLVK